MRKIGSQTRSMTRISNPNQKKVNSMTTTNKARYSRQADLIPQKRLQQTPITIIGVGAIGRQLATQLTMIGAPTLTLIDFDRVDESNLASQGYRERDLGRLKVEATADALREHNQDIHVTTTADRFRPQQEIGGVVFCSVDTMTNRQAIWRSVGSKSRFWGDVRMLGESIRLLIASDDSSRWHYSTTLFPQSDAQLGRCTAKATYYVANVAAGWMLANFARWLRGQPTDADTSINLLAGEVMVTSIESLRQIERSS